VINADEAMKDMVAKKHNLPKVKTIDLLDLFPAFHENIFHLAD